jgi:hypothetical protein
MAASAEPMSPAKKSSGYYPANSFMIVSVLTFWYHLGFPEECQSSGSNHDTPPEGRSMQIVYLRTRPWKFLIIALSCSTFEASHDADFRDGTTTRYLISSARSLVGRFVFNTAAPVRPACGRRSGL